MRKIENDVQSLSSGKSTQGRGGFETWRGGIETELTFYAASGKLELGYFFFLELSSFKQPGNHMFSVTSKECSSELKKIKSMFLRINLLWLPVENC